MENYTKVSTGAEAAPVPSAASRYEQLALEREPYLQRAREASKLTIPSLIPPAGQTGAMNLYKPFQSTGADGVNNLASKLQMALFPPGSPFFKLSISDLVVRRLSASFPVDPQTGQPPDVKGKLEGVLGRMERSIVDRMEENGARAVHFEALQHLVVGGNGLLYLKEEGKEKFFPLSKYVVCRDSDDNVIEVITKECIAKEALPDELREVVDEHYKSSSGDSQGKAEEVDVFTWVRREKRRWVVHQEVCGRVVGKPGFWPLDKPAMIPLRWTRVSGEAYGRGRCEEYIGDLRSLETLQKAIVTFAAAASKILLMVTPGGVTEMDDIVDSESGDVIPGRATDVTVLQLDKAQDFQVAKSIMEETKLRLEAAFLKASSIQRQAERVTAEEIRLMAAELEQGLGGVYSILSEEFQRPLVSRLMAVMSRGENPLPELPKGAVNPKIVTGLDGLGRNTDLQRLDTLIAGVGQTFGNEAVAKWINIGAYIERRAKSLGIETLGLIRSDEEIAAQDQKAQMQEMAGKLGGPAIGAVSEQLKAMREQGGPQSAAPEQPQATGGDANG